MYLLKNHIFICCVSLFLKYIIKGCNATQTLLVVIFSFFVCFVINMYVALCEHVHGLTPVTALKTFVNTLLNMNSAWETTNFKSYYFVAY